MKRIGRDKLKKLMTEMGWACARGDTARWRTWYDQASRRRVELAFPLGELTNPRIAGFVWAWQKTGRLNTTGKLTKRDGFIAQGLEGKAIVKTNLVTALLVCRELPAYRRAVYE